MEFKDVYRYMTWIYQCDRCGQRFPVWMVNNSAWKKGVKLMGLGRTRRICKPCFEDFNPEPRYLSLEEYIAYCLINPSTEMLTTLTEVWDQPSQYSEAERQEELDYILGRKEK